MRDVHLDITAVVGLVVLGVIGVMAILFGDDRTVAAAAVGAIGGFMARGPRTTTTTNGDPSVRTTTEATP